MALIKKWLSKLIPTVGQPSETNGIKIENEWVYVYVQCDHCGEILTVRLSKRREIQRNYDEAPERTYFVRKVLTGSRCFHRMTLELNFDRRYRPTKLELKGGTFVSPERAADEEAPKPGR